MRHNITLVNTLNRGHCADPDQTVVEPLGCLYLMSYARRAGFEVRLRDLQTLLVDGVARLDLPGLWQAVGGPTSDILGFSCMSHCMPLGVVLAEYHKKARPDSIVILGGAGPSGCAAELLEEFPFIDYVVRGEGEEALLRILMAADSGWGLPGRGVVDAPPLELDGLPGPDRTVVADPRYETAVITSRGCAFSCTFCSSKVQWGKQVRLRSPENVVAELLEVRRLLEEGRIRRIEPDRVGFPDDTFVHSVNWMKRFADLLRQNELRIRFVCYARIEQLSPDMLRLLRETGCMKLHVGVESGSRSVQQAISTKADRERVVRVCRQAAETLGRVSASFMYGFPFETLDDVRQTMDLIVELDRVGAETMIRPLIPLRGSELVRTMSDDYELDQQVLYQELESYFFQQDVVDATIGCVRDHHRLFLNFCRHRAGQVEEKERVLSEYVGVI